MSVTFRQNHLKVTRKKVDGVMRGRFLGGFQVMAPR